ncbi:MAG: type II CRISPR RNA-guided endonuclease Cas9 [Clostridia bacterium]|nr:type II CRISPR RNA-guided endonuclease Cas9 [Clostridia bacterium]
MKYIMGLDIGISSVGWAVINDEKHRIEDLGVRLFSAAEKPKDGGPINAERRIARGLRRRLKRRRVRMDKIKELFVKYELISEEEKDKLYILNSEDIDTWQLRSEGLDRKLNPREWTRALTAIAKRRGYQSNRKNEADLDKTGESKKILNAIKLNKAYMTEKGYRTVGEMFAKDERYQEHKRNKHGDYSNCIDRSELEEEVIILFDCQRKYENEYTSVEFEKEFLEVFRYQKGFMSAELMEKMIGKCTLEKEEPRVSKNTWSFERFMLLQKVNNLSYESKDGKVYLLPEERKKIIHLAYEIKSGIKYSRIKKELKLPDDAKFVGLNYFVKGKKNKDGSYERPTDEEIIKRTEDTVFVKLPGYHEIKDALVSKGLIDSFEKISMNHDLMDEIAKELTLNKTSVAIE